MLISGVLEALSFRSGIGYEGWWTDVPGMIVAVPILALGDGG